MPYNYYPYQYYTPYQQQYSKPISLSGKVIDNLEAVKTADVLLDGTTSYYPLADGTAIASKQLKQDGTSRIIIYRPETETKEVKYVTETDLESIKKDIEELRKQIKVGENHESNTTN